MRISMKMSVAAFVATLAGTTAPAFADVVYYVEPAPGAVYVDPMATGSVYVDPVPMRRGYYVYRPPARTLGDARERYMNEYQSGGQGDYYLGVTHPAPVP